MRQQMTDSEKLLTREQILEIQDIESEIIEVPEWGGLVKVQGMTGAERDVFESSVMKGKGKNIKINWRNLRAKLVAHSVVNGNGERIFTDADVIRLGNKSALALDKVFAVAQRLSGITSEDVAELAEEIKNDQSDGSGLD
jgi:hypothetical protein